MSCLKDLKMCVPKILPLVYDESLSYYEVICKLVDKVNEVANSVNSVNLLTFADPIEWDITSQYAEHTVVVDGKTGTAYLSRQNVKAGIYLSNVDYWTPIYNYDAIIDELIKQLGYYESDYYASRNYKNGDCVFIARELYLCIADISKGDKLNNGNNITPIKFIPYVTARYDEIIEELVKQLGYYESDYYASRNYKNGDCVFIARKLYLCIADISKGTKLNSGDNITPVKLIPYVTARYESDNERIVLAGVQKANISELCDYHVYNESNDTIEIKKLEDEL